MIYLAIVKHASLDRRDAQSGNPVKSGGRQLFTDAGVGDHAAVTNQNNALKAEPLFQLFESCDFQR